MRQYLVDELRKEEVERIRERLSEGLEESDIKGLFWLRMPDDILGPVQHQHSSCGPHCTAVELGDGWLKFELLVRARGRIRCECVGYATEQQRRFVLRFADNLLEECGIVV